MDFKGVMAMSTVLPKISNKGMRNKDSGVLDVFSSEFAKDVGEIEEAFIKVP